jgi:outer membrane receptor protein involved in Fe transport
MLSGTLAWERGGRAFSATLRRVGAQFEDDLNEEQLKPATTLDLFAAWPLTRHFQLVARGENIFDKVVEAAVGADGAIERATPRTLWLGLRFNTCRERGCPPRT